MAVYERTYRPYAGPLTELNRRFLVLPRYSFQNIFKSKIFVAFVVLCLVWPAILSLIIYLPYNSTFLKTIQAMAGETFSLKFKAASYFTWFMVPQSILAFLMSLFVGPALVSTDLRNNALPLYLSRPFDRKDYILGKASVLLILLSLITWVPGLLLFGLQAYLEGWSWFADSLWTPAAIFLGSWVWILLLSLISLAISAYLKWKAVAQAAYFGLFLMGIMVQGVILALFQSELGGLFNMTQMMWVVWAGLFRIEDYTSIAPLTAWFSILAHSGLFLALVFRKVRAYEVVK
jgi:ABC-2 type transport system permease protein